MNSSISILALCSLIAGGWNIDRPRPSATATTKENCEWVGRILRAENSQIEAAKPLCTGDALELESDAQILILCYGSGEIWDVPSGEISRMGDRCTPPPQLLAEDNCTDPKGCYEDDGRNPDGNQPNIILPLSEGFVLAQMPMLSWFAIDGATHYNLKIQDIAESEPARETTIEALEVEISEAGTISLDFPFHTPLSQDRRYRLTIEAVTQADTATVSRRNFSILNEETAMVVEEITAKLDGLNLPYEEKVLVDLYHLYIARNLKASAIESLEALKEQGSQNPRLYRILGMLYEEQDWLDLAKSHYERGEELAMATGNTQELERIRIQLDRLRDLRSINLML